MSVTGNISVYLGEVMSVTGPVYVPRSWFTAYVRGEDGDSWAAAEINFDIRIVSPEERDLVVEGARFYYMTDPSGNESVTMIKSPK